MPFEQGDANCTTGCSGDAWAFLAADGRNGFPPGMTATQENMLKAIVWAVVQAVALQVPNLAVVTACPAGSGTGTVT